MTGLALVAVGCGGGDNADDTPTAQCGDGEDNDGDGSIDFPDDLGCTSATDESEDSPTSSQCQDGRDNDGDGYIDFPYDPGCFAPQADSETDDCPNGPNCPQCSDGKDDDGNGAMDFPNDPGCESAADDQEFPLNPVACGANLTITTLPVTNVVDGMLDASSLSQLTSPCGGGGSAPARAYVLHLDAPKVVELSTDSSQTRADTVIDLRSMNCLEATAEVACNDDIDTDNTNSKLSAAVPAGSYYIIVSGVDSATTGAFHLDVRLYNGEGTACGGPGDCGPGLVCRTPLGGTSDVCAKPMCSDGVDDDGDTKADYPDDPGCASADDVDETDDCPDGPNCPACGDGDDNDNDGMTDYPADTTCQSAGDASESCLSTDGVQQIVAPMTTGTTSGAHDDLVASCAYYDDGGGDLWYRLDLPALSSLAITATSSDYTPMLDLYDASCGGASLQCDEYYGELALDAVQAGTYYVLVDAYDPFEEGPFSLEVSGKIRAQGRCDGVLAQSGALTCGAGYACKDAGGGTKTCQPALCGDGIDNDGDGVADFPNDPGCESIGDDTETDPATPPVCANHSDDDGDGLQDWPADYGCTAASGTSEVFCTGETDATALITTPTVMGTTIGKTHNLTPTACASSISTAADAVYALSLPVQVDQLVLDTIGTTDYDTVIYVRTPACTGDDLGCDDDSGDDTPYNGALHTSRLVMNAVAPGNYAIVVDGYSSSTTSHAFTLNVKGTVAPQTVCDSPLFTAGVLACPMGTACTGAAPKRCQ